ncbi:MAG: hypothetical protein GY856_51370, partial [bacterium]|nr:hypothetical protein [bacterium]
MSDSECLENDPTLDCLDGDQARREVEIQYELESNRVMVEAYGGLHSGDGPLYAQSYTYHAENRSPWADEVAALESVPGESNLVETFRTSYVRDAFGRPLIQTSSNGLVSHTAYDRAGGAIRMRTGAGTTTSVAFDSRGLPIRQIRPNDRGETRYAFDLDGRLLRQVVTAGNGEEWETV